MAANELSPEEIKKEANRAYQREWRKANAEKQKAYQEKYRQSEKGKETLREKEKRRRGTRTEQHKQYAAAHREQINAAMRRRYEANPLQQRAAAKKWRDENPEITRAMAKRYRKEHADEIRERQARYRAAHLAEIKKHKKMMRDLPESRMKRLLSSARCRAKQRGWEFDGLPHLVGTMPPECACCRVQLDYRRNQGRSPLYAPSLDRVDTKKGYTKDNVHVVCLRCNQIKNDASLERLENIVAYMRRHLATFSP